MGQAFLAAVWFGLGVFVVVGAISTLIHHLHHGEGRRYLWGVAVIAVLMAIYTYLNYLGR